jgi:autotransporter-associated beta strand protein
LGSFTLGSLSTLANHSITLSGSAITMDNGGGNVVITKQLALTAGRSSDSINNNLVLAGNLLVSNSTAASAFDFFVLNLRGTITESGGSRSVTVNAGGGVNLNNTANSYTGKTTVNSGYFSFASIGNVGMGNSSLGNPANAVDGTIALGSGINEVFFRYTGTAADATTDRVLDFAGTNQTVNLSTVARKITYTSPFSFSGTGTKILQVASEGEVIISSSIAYGNLSFRAGSTTATGTASLLGLNTFTGTTSIGRCSLTINSIADYDGTPSSLGAPTTLASGTIWMSPNSDSIESRLVYIGTGHSSNRPIALVSGSFAAIDASGSGKLLLTGNISNTGARNRILKLNGTGEGELGGVINNFDSTRLTSLIKSGTGAWTLSGANTYTGTTGVLAGNLRVNGSIAAGSTVEVAAAGTLSGTGTINGLTAITGTHSPGDVVGVQTFNADLTYSAGSIVNWDLLMNSTGGSAVADQVAVPNGNVTFAGATGLNLAFTGPGSTVAWSDPFWGSDRSWLLYDLSTGVTNGIGDLSINPQDWLDSTLAPLSASRPNASFAITQLGQDVYITYVAVPEPAAGVLAVFAVAGLAASRSFRRKQSA